MKNGENLFLAKLLKRRTLPLFLVSVRLIVDCMCRFYGEKQNRSRIIKNAGCNSHDVRKLRKTLARSHGPARLEGVFRQERGVGAVLHLEDNGRFYNLQRVPPAAWDIHSVIAGQRVKMKTFCLGFVGRVEHNLNLAPKQDVRLICVIMPVNRQHSPGLKGIQQPLRRSVRTLVQIVVHPQPRRSRSL